MRFRSFHSRTKRPWSRVSARCLRKHRRRFTPFPCRSCQVGQPPPSSLLYSVETEEETPQSSLLPSQHVRRDVCARNGMNKGCYFPSCPSSTQARRHGPLTKCTAPGTLAGTTIDPLLLLSVHDGGGSELEVPLLLWPPLLLLLPSPSSSLLLLSGTSRNVPRTLALSTVAVQTTSDTTSCTLRVERMPYAMEARPCNCCHAAASCRVCLLWSSCSTNTAARETPNR